MIKNLTQQRAEGMRKEIGEEIARLADEYEKDPRFADKQVPGHVQIAINRVLTNQVANFAAVMDLTDVLAEIK